jgi:cobalt-zinc-cadmium efflux system protein
MPHDHSHHEHAHHGHPHGHAGHSHAPAAFGRAFAIGAALNAAFVALQVFYGLAANSVALLADAVHNLGDVLGLLIAWGAATLTRRAPTPRRTYGWGRSSILAALGNAVILLLSCGAIAVEAAGRFGSPAPVAAWPVMLVAAAGIIVNGGTALLFLRGRHGDLNVRGAFLHMVGDAAVSLGVVVSSALILWTGWQWLDPLTSLGIVALITWSTWGLLRQSVDLAMDAVPAGVDQAAVQAALERLPGVVEVHDLHIWGLSTTRTALTAHLVLARPDAGLVQAACAMLHDQFGLDHATLQVEEAEAAEKCALRPAAVV